jgi:hypothetical protein
MEGNKMATKNIQITVSKETHEFGVGLTNFIREMKGALANGWQPSEDIPIALTASIQHLVPAIQGMDKAGEEWEENKTAFINALTTSLAEISDLFVK